MTDPTRISLSIDDTVNALNSLQQGSQARRADWLAQLRDRVSRLDDAGPPDELDEPLSRPARSDERPPVRGRETDPDVDLPQRRLSRGGEWGPAMRERLTRIALDKGRW